MDSSTCDFNVVTSTGLYFSFLCALWLFLYSLSPTGTDLFTLSSLVTAVPPCCHGPLGPLRWASVTHDCTSHSCTMEHRTLYELLGLDARAKKQDIKLAYRRLAKLYHPDKNTSPQATALFQELNQAYHTLTDDKLRVEYDALIGVSERHTDTSHGDSVCVKSLTNVTINIRENIMSVTIDITDIMFLAFVEQCERYYGMQPIDRGHHGLQFKFEYHSPLEPESYGSISLTFYPSTSRLLVQGSSYLLWVEEHLPSIYSDTESEFITHTSKWAFLTRQRGIGRKREHRPLSNATRAEMAVTTDTLPVCKPAVSSSTTATVCTPAVSTSTATAPCTSASVVSAGLEAAPFASAESSSATAAMHALAIPVSTAMSISTTAVTHAPVSSSGRATVTDASESYCPSDAVNPVVEPDTPTAMHGSSSGSPAASPAEAAEILTSPETVTQAAGPTTRQAFKAGATMIPVPSAGNERKRRAPQGFPTGRVKKKMFLQAAPRMLIHVSLAVMSLPKRLLTWSGAHCACPGTITFVLGKTGAMLAYGPVCPAADSLPWSSTYRHRSPTLHRRWRFIKRTMYPKKISSTASNLRITDYPKRSPALKTLMTTSRN